MNITFVYPDVLEFVPDYPGHYYVGIGSLASFLRAQGHRTALIHIIRMPARRDTFIGMVRERQPSLVAFSCTTLQFSMIQKVAQWIKEEWPGVPTICGGVHPTLMPEQVLTCPSIDMVCVGEGEHALATLCKRLAEKKDLRDIHNIWIKQNNEIHRNTPALPVNDLDTLPFPERSIFNYPSLWWERKGTATLMASRGCPYNCNYCCNKALRDVYPDKIPPFRLRSVENVLEEVGKIRKDYPFIDSFNFDDDIFFLNKKWAHEFTEQYSDQVGLPFYCNIRPNVVDREIVALMKHANCQEVRIGVESGDDRIRNSVLNRNLSRHQILNACRLFLDAGITARTFNIIGIPEETPKEVLETIKINAEIGIDFPQYTVFYPFPGTQLFTLCKESDILPCREMKDYFSDTALDLPSLSHEHLQMFRAYFLRIMQLYRFLFRLHPHIRTPLVTLSDSFFASTAAPRVMRFLHKILRVKRRAHPLFKGRMEPYDQRTHQEDPGGGP